MKKPEVLWKLGALQLPPIPIWKKNQTAKQFRASWYMFFFQLPAPPELLFKQSDYAAFAKSLKRSTAAHDVFSDEDIVEYKKAWSQPGATTAMLNFYRANILKRMFGKSEMPPRSTCRPYLFMGKKTRPFCPKPSPAFAI
jgi:hypothetical protein